MKQDRKNRARFLGERRTSLSFFAVLLASGAALLILNFYTPLYMDDFSYMRDFATKAPISSLSDLLRSMAVHYQKVNGRYAPHFLAQLFLWWGKPVFCFLNTAAGLFLLFGIYRLAFPHRRGETFRPFFLLSAALGLWLCTPAFGQSYLWLTGACSYLWGAAAGVSALALFRRAPCERKGREIPLCAGLFLLGFLAGNAAENGAAALLTAAVGYTLADRLVMTGETDRRPLFCRGACLTVGVLSGIVLTLAAPGEWTRLAGEGGTLSVPVLFGRFWELSLRYLRWLWLPLLLSVGLLLFCRVRRRPLPRRACLEAAVLFLGSLAGQFSLVLSPASPDRALCFSVIYGVAAFLRLCAGVFPAPLWGHGPRLACCLAAAAFVLSFALTAAHLHGIYQAYLARDLAAQEQIAAGAHCLTLPILSDDSRFSLYESWGDLDGDPAAWQNVALARYYGVDAVAGQHPDAGSGT